MTVQVRGSIQHPPFGEYQYDDRHGNDDNPIVTLNASEGLVFTSEIFEVDRASLAIDIEVVAVREGSGTLTAELKAANRARSGMADHPAALPTFTDPIAAPESLAPVLVSDFDMLFGQLVLTLSAGVAPDIDVRVNIYAAP